jgi:copper(I)-binding protein
LSFAGSGSGSMVQPLVLLAVMLSALMAPTRSASPAPSTVLVLSGWSTVTPVGVNVAEGYARIANPTGRADRLLGGTSSWAQRVEINRRVVRRGKKQLQPVKGGVRIGPHSTLELRPDGYHLLLVGLRRPLRAGDRVPVVLRFRRAGLVQFHLYVGGASVNFSDDARR